MQIAFDLFIEARDGTTKADLPEYEFSMQRGPWTVLAAKDESLLGRVFDWARKQPFKDGFVVADDRDEIVSFFDIYLLRKYIDDDKREEKK